MPKIPALPGPLATIADDDLVVIEDTSATTTKRLAALVLKEYINPDTGYTTPRVRMTEDEFDFVASGMVWSGDSYASTKNGSMTAGVIYINGRRISISAVTAHLFTASKDTYVDVLDNVDGTGTVVYTEVANNAASPALAANSVRIAIIVTDTTDIQSVGSVNQGQESKVLPIVSSIPYAVTDSLGNLICPRDPQRKTLGYRQITSSATSSGTGNTATNLQVPVKIPANRKYKITAYTNKLSNSSASQCQIELFDGAGVGGTQLQAATVDPYVGSAGYSAHLGYESTNDTASVLSNTFSLGIQAPSAGTATAAASSTAPAYIKVELV